MAGNRDFVLNDVESAKGLTRNNHYVPQWYQKGFANTDEKLHYLDLSPDVKVLPNGRVIVFNDKKQLPPSQCFFEYDLYTTFFGPFISDIFERKLFGHLDDLGARAVRAFIDGTELERHDRFMQFFDYIDAQKTRTPKGLSWLKSKYGGLDQSTLMFEMQAVQKMHCTIWLEGIREIVSAKESNVKFIVTDHPVTVYNYACLPDAVESQYPDDPPIAWKASQTIFPLDKDHCLILTNYEYGSDPNLKDPKTNRTNARNFAETMVRTNAWIRTRSLSDREVQELNFVMKSRARRFVAAAEKDWLYPENDESISWESVRETLLPPANKIYEFGGEMFAGFADGRTYFQDAFGRTTPDLEFLKKQLPSSEPGANDPCPCGQGRKYKRCCKGLTLAQRPSWEARSIRERNMLFYNCLNNILGFNEGKDWDDIRRDLSSDQVRDIHEAFGLLWPVDTDIISLLPKPDKRLRAVYTGMIDVCTFARFATGATLYFDEIIIQNPFMNLAGYNPEFNPVEHPSKFRQQTLKHVCLFIELYPYILNGSINFIPDPTVFNKHLRFQTLDMAKQRNAEGISMDEKEQKQIEKLLEQDHKRMMWSLPEEQQRHMFKESFPDAPDSLITKLYNYSQKLRKEDPFSLLQDNLYGVEGQIEFRSMAPGSEMATFLAQLTGAIIFTDSPTRWNEILKASDSSNSANTSKWSTLVDFIHNQKFPFCVKYYVVPELRERGKMGLMRQAWQEIYLTITTITESDISGRIEQLKRALENACSSATKEMYSDEVTGGYELAAHTFDASFECYIPGEGIANRSVQRLLISCGIENYFKNVPMVILARQVLG